MPSNILKVVVIDDDGLTVRRDVFERFFAQEANRLGKELNLVIYTAFPPFTKLEDADVVSWDNDLGFSKDLGENAETVRMLRQLQFTDGDYLDSLKGRTHFIHSMNPVASDSLFTILSQDLGLKTLIIPFNQMKTLIEE